MSFDDIVLRTFQVFGLGLLVYLFKQVLIDPYYNRKKLANLLLLNIELIQTLQKESSYIICPLNIWNEVQNTPVLVDLKKSQKNIMILYSRIHNKNNVLDIWKRQMLIHSQTEKRTEIQFMVGTEYKPLTTVIQMQTTSILELIEETIPLLKSDIKATFKI